MWQTINSLDLLDLFPVEVSVYDFMIMFCSRFCHTVNTELCIYVRFIFLFLLIYLEIWKQNRIILLKKKLKPTLLHHCKVFTPHPTPPPPARKYVTPIFITPPCLLSGYIPVYNFSLKGDVLKTQCFILIQIKDIKPDKII